jgi:hypothetical protein
MRRIALKISARKDGHEFETPDVILDLDRVG